MKQPRFPLRINVGFLLNTPIGTYRDIHFEFDEILLGSDLNMTDFSGFARVGRTPQGIVVHGEFQGKASAECSRCLIDFQQPLQTSFDDLYAFDKRSTTESGLILPDDANIDMEPLVRDFLLIEMPINPICRPDCKGICVVCGQNLNEENVEHYHPEEETE